MEDRAGPPTEIALRRNRIFGAVSATAFLGLGIVFLVLSLGPPVRPFGFVLAAVFLVPGTWVIPLMLRPWRLDRCGIRLGHRRVLTWEEVESIEVRDVRPEGAGRGPAHVTVVVRSAEHRATLVLYSRSDAEEVAGLLEKCLTTDVPGRMFLVRIPEAWTGIR